jgi:hypothetical protein
MKLLHGLYCTVKALIKRNVLEVHSLLTNIVRVGGLTMTKHLAYHTSKLFTVKKFYCTVLKGPKGMTYDWCSPWNS